MNRMIISKVIASIRAFNAKAWESHAIWTRMQIAVMQQQQQQREYFCQ